MNTFKAFLISKLFWLLFIPLFLGCLIAVAGYYNYQNDIVSLKKLFQEENHQKSILVKASIEANLSRLYHGLRTIARLPDIRAIQNSQINNKKSLLTVQEIYNNLATDLEISEVYITLSDFVPGQTNSVTGEQSKPLVMFDELILGNTKLKEAASEKNDTELVTVKEIEEFEYRLIHKQINWFSKKWPNEDSIKGLHYPGISGKEVITCDNSRYDSTHPDDKDRSGLVYSVPFYNNDGQFHGVVTGIVLSDVLRSWLPDSHFRLRNSSYNYVVSKNDSNFVKTKQFNEYSDENLIYSDQINLNIIDGDSTWVLWAEIPNSTFWEQAIVKSETKFHAYLLAGVIFCVIFMIVFLLRNAAYNEKVKNNNIELERRIIERTNELRSSRDKSEHDSQYYNSILSNMGEALIMINGNGVIISFNPAAEKMFGYESGEVISKQINMLMPEQTAQHHGSYLQTYLKRNQSDTIGINRKIYAQHKSGYEFPIEISLTEIKLGEQLNIIGTIHNISEQEKIEKSLLIALDAAEVANLAKSQFLSTMSHEIRTPMNGVLGMIQLIKDTNLSIEQQGYIDVISNSGHSLLRIINDILDFSKMEAGELKIDNTIFNLEQTIFEVVQLLTTNVKQKNIHFMLNYSLECPAYVYGDSTRIRQVIMNLVGNAIKFTKLGHIYIVVKQIGKVDSQCNLRIEIQDTGLGISEKALPQLFDSFTQADSSITRHYGGTGLGLAISKQIVELMGGEIGVESKLDSGSTFWFTLTLAEKILDGDVKNEIIEDTKILIVDNYDFSRVQLETQLSGIGGIVSSVNSGDNALTEILNPKTVDDVNESVFNIIIIDHNIGDTETSELIKNIRINKKLDNVGIVLLSSLDEFGDIEKYEKAGVNAYFSRPIVNSTLYKVLNKIVENEDISQNKIITQQYLKDKDDSNAVKKIKLSGSILVVEDNDINTRVIEALLNKLEVSYESVVNGKLGVACWQAGDFDLILMDCQMPVLDGFLATAEIRKIEQQQSTVTIPIIALTANVEEGEKEKCIDAGMDDFLTKPIEVVTLQAMLQKWIVTKSNIENHSDYINLEDRVQLQLDETIPQETLDLKKMEQLQELMGDAMVDLVESYVEGSSKKLAEMQQALELMDATEMYQLAHGLKGSSGNVGANRVMELSEKIEQLAKHKQLDNISEIIDELLLAFADTQQQMKSVVNR